MAENINIDKLKDEEKEEYARSQLAKITREMNKLEEQKNLYLSIVNSKPPKSNNNKNQQPFDISKFKRKSVAE